MIDRLAKNSAEEAGFNLADARAAGWIVHEPEARVEGHKVVHGYYHAEKCDAKTRSMQRASRHQESELAEEIFGLEKAEFDRARANDPRQVEYLAMKDAVEDAERSFGEQFELVAARFDTAPVDDRRDVHSPNPLSGLSRGTDAIDVFVSTGVGVAGSRLPIVGEGERLGCSRQEGCHARPRQHLPGRRLGPPHRGFRERLR